jgi:NTP pyrophosphatase (non-canonical NTP hydrolase)
MIRKHNINSLPTEAQAERLYLLIEEMAEATKAATKILRFGLENHHPSSSKLNIDDLEKELGHILFAIELLRNSTDILYNNVLKYKLEKMVTIGKWLQFQ